MRSLVGLGWRCLTWGEGMEERPMHLMHLLPLRHLLISAARDDAIRWGMSIKKQDRMRSLVVQKLLRLGWQSHGAKARKGDLCTLCR